MYLFPTLPDDIMVGAKTPSVRVDGVELEPMRNTSLPVETPLLGNGNGNGVTTLRHNESVTGNPSDPSLRVTFNVGGCVFQTSEETVSKSINHHFKVCTLYTVLKESTSVRISHYTLCASKATRIPKRLDLPVCCIIMMTLEICSSCWRGVLNNKLEYDLEALWKPSRKLFNNQINNVNISTFSWLTLCSSSPTTTKREKNISLTVTRKCLDLSSTTGEPDVYIYLLQCVDLR